jgi:hypothetical protein
MVVRPLLTDAQNAAPPHQPWKTKGEWRGWVSSRGGHFRGEVGLTRTKHALERQGAREQGSGGVTRASSPRLARSGARTGTDTTAADYGGKLATARHAGRGTHM